MSAFEERGRDKKSRTVGELFRDERGRHDGQSSSTVLCIAKQQQEEASVT